MELRLTKIVPRGFCKGVTDAWAASKKIAKLYPNQKKYMIGWLVHNKTIIDELENSGIQTIDDTNQSRYEIIKNIKEDPNTVIIFSAHGSDPKAIELAIQKGFKVVDTTCIYVTDTHNIIKEKLKENKKVIFIGVKNHPETKSSLSLSKEIILVENPNDVDNLNLNKNEPIFVTNQTTISVYDFYYVTKRLSERFTNIEFKNDICNATKERQEAILNMDSTIDLLIIVGDKKSNNSKKLVDIGKQKNVESYLVNNENEIDLKWLVNKKHIGVSSGCSTPTQTTNKVIQFLEKYIENNNEKQI